MSGVSPDKVAQLTLDLVAARAEVKRLRAALHDCSACEDCVHDGRRCCGCYDGACCQREDD